MTNNNIKKIMHKMVIAYKSWHGMLSYALHGYWTVMKPSIRPNLFSSIQNEGGDAL